MRSFMRSATGLDAVLKDALTYRQSPCLTHGRAAPPVLRVTAAVRSNPQTADRVRNRRIMSESVVGWRKASVRRSLAAVVLALGMATTATVTGFVSTAEAAPTGCRAFNVRIWSGASTCSGGSGTHRVQLTCQAGPVYYTYYGPWVKAGSRSETSCKTWQGRAGVGFQTRN